MRLYADACVIIYLVETEQPFSRQTALAIEALGGRTGAVMLSSILSRLECRVRPVRDRDQATLDLYDAFFASGDVEVLVISDAIIERATELRARHGFKTPDAIHLATAIEARADLFLTGDRRLAKCPGVRIEVIGEPEKEPAP